MTLVQSDREPSPPADIAAGAAFHEILAASWSRGYAGGSFRRRLEFLMSRLDGRVRAGQTWVDAGCGSGVLSRELADRGAEVVALDASPAMLAEARGVAPAPGQRIRYDQIASVERLPLPDASADGILCSSVLEYVVTPAAALAEFHRVLRPDGVLVLTVPNRLSVIRGAQATARALVRVFGVSAYDYLSVSRHSYFRRGIERDLVRAGFAVEDVALFSPKCQHVLAGLGLGALWLVIARRRGPILNP